MSSPRVLVGLAAERALPPAFLLLRRNHGSDPLRAAMRSLGAVATRPCLSSQKPTLHSRAIHTTTYLLFPSDSSSNQPNRPTPRPFHLTPYSPPSIHPHTSTTDPSTPLPEQFRNLMRLITHSVVVCTSTHPGSTTSLSSPSPQNQTEPSPPTSPTPRAMTMSSFTSLALTPTPVVSFNIAVPSRTHDAIAASRRFNIHVLADDIQGARVADWLAGGYAQYINNVNNGKNEGRGVEDWEGDDGSRAIFEGLRHGAGCEVDVLPEGREKGVAEPPVIKGDGVLYVLRCRLLDQPMGGLVKVRDHVIVLGEVMEIVEGYGAERETEERFGLLYADRRYRQLGGCIMPGEKEGQ